MARRSPRHLDHWDARAIVAALVDWADTYGEGNPASLTDWTPSLARKSGREDKAVRFEREHPRWPPSSRVVHVFGSWNEAIAAAGFVPMQPGRARCFGNTGQVWTRERVIAALREWAAEHGRAPEGHELEASSERVRHAGAPGEPRGSFRRWPTSSTVVRLFGSFHEALNAAELEATRPTPGTFQDRALLVDLLKRWVRAHGESPPRMQQWDRTSDEFRARLARVQGGPVFVPTAGTVVCAFGSWGAALIAAGFTAHGYARRHGADEPTLPRVHRPAVHWTRERITAAVRDWVAEHGYPPNSGDWQDTSTKRGEPGRWPHTGTVVKVFGSHDAALIAAGFEPAARTRWTRARIIAAIRDWVLAYGEIPTTTDLNAHELRRLGDTDRLARLERDPLRWPTGGTVSRAFGSYADAIRAAGYEPRTPWTRERVIDEIRRWHATYGELPMAKDWSLSDLRASGDGARLARHEQSLRPWPSATVTAQLFGSHASALEAAGFELPDHLRNRAPRGHWTRERILAAIRDWHTTHGAVPNSIDWNPKTLAKTGDTERLERFRAGRHVRWPTFAVVVRHFGNMAAAVEAAGLQPRRGRRIQWSADAGLAAIRQCATEQAGKTPSSREYERWRSSHNEAAEGDRLPSTTAILNQFGTWTRAVEAAGFTARTRYDKAPRLWTKETVLEAFLRWHELHGALPRSAQMNKCKDRTNGQRVWPTLGTVQQLFGSWTIARQHAAALLDPEHGPGAQRAA